MSSLLGHLLAVPPALALLLIFVVPMAEASVFAGFVFPGEIAIMLGGVLANEGRLPLWSVILVGSLGSITGDSIGYEVGRRFGNRLLERIPRRLLHPERVAQGQELLRAKGGRAVFVGRFTVALRVLVPGLAGASGLRYSRFLLFNVLGAVAWAAETAVVGYVVGKGYKAAEHRLSLISLGVLGVVAVLLAVRYVRRSTRARAYLTRRLGPLARLDRSLGLALAGFAGTAWFFAAVTDEVHSGETAAFDHRVLHDVLVQRTTLLNPVAKAVTTLGTDPVVYAVLALAGLLVLARRRGRWPVIAAFGVLLSGQLVRLAINHGLARARPPVALWLVHPGGYAFPSGHTTTATLGYALVAVLLVRARLLRPWVAGGGAAVLAAAVGMSRVYLGVHWPTDVIGGWLLATAWLALAGAALVGLRPVAARRWPRQAGGVSTPCSVAVRNPVGAAGPRDLRLLGPAETRTALRTRR